jgi:proteasome accessory factor C
MEQPKTEILLRMLVTLSNGVRYSVKELAALFATTERTVYRYLNSIENAGFVIDRRNGIYTLHLCRDETKVMNTLLHFSEEEAYILYKALDMVKGGAPISDRLVRKLNVLYDFRVLSKLARKPYIETIRTLHEAISQKKQVSLCAYRSSHSETIADRKVEPFEFLSEYSGLWCYDTQDNICKQFKISRIEKVEILDSGWLNESLHRVPFLDAFRMSAPNAIAIVEAELTLKAANLLIEEYPLAESCLKTLEKKPLRYLLSIPVADFHGIGRFALGLPGEVKVLGPEGFKNFLKEIKKKDVE